MKILETRRLVLRHLEPQDLDDLFALYSDAEVRRSLVDAANLASIRVATKIGMAFEREGNDEKGPFLLYSKRAY